MRAVQNELLRYLQKYKKILLHGSLIKKDNANFNVGKCPY